MIFPYIIFVFNDWLAWNLVTLRAFIGLNRLVKYYPDQTITKYLVTAYIAPDLHFRYIHQVQFARFYLQEQYG